MSIPNRIAVLNADGTTDTSFNPNNGLNAEGLCVVCLAGGRIVAGGAFTGAAGQGRARLAVFESSGALVNTSLSAGGTVRALAVQTDGKVLVGGSFQTLGGLARIRLARLRADMTVEPAYEPSSNGAIYAIATQEDGKTLIGGGFTGISGQARSHLARLQNDDAAQSLAVLSAAAIRWLRGGASAETMRVSFEADTGSGYAAVGGTVTRIPGGWEVTGLALSGTGTLRARAWPADGHSAGILEALKAFAFVPEIQVIVGGESLVTGGGLDFGSVQSGATSERILTVRNMGLSNLTLTGGTPVTKSGTNSNQWTIVNQPSSPVAPGEAVSFTMRFVPTAAGSKVATLSIASDDSDENPFTLSLTGTATPGPGALDTSWQPVANAVVTELAVHDSAVLIGGAFTTVSGLLRGRWARIGMDGSLLAQTGVGANNSMVDVTVMPDGAWVLVGIFTTMNGVARRLARIKPDGTLDSSANWNAAFNESVLMMAPLPDGSLFLAGTFTTMKGQVRKGAAKLLPSGALDTSWNHTLSCSACWTLAPLADGSIYLGTNTVGLVKLQPNGVQDSTFNASAAIPDYGMVLAIQPTRDGKILVAGRDASFNSYLKRLNADGTLDGTWTATTPPFNTLAVQADGKVLVSSLSSGTHQRLQANGTADTGFVFAPESLAARALALDETGRVYAADGVGRSLCRMVNGPASSSLTVPTAARVLWMRDGTAPEADWVLFELSEDAGISWRTLGTGTRITGGWELAGLSLPRQGRVRGRARTGSGMQERVTVFSGLPVPDLDVEQPAGTVIADGGTLAFPPMLPGQSVDVTLTLRNTGNADLTGLTLTTAGEWVVISLGATVLVAGQSTTAILRFTPTAVGARTAALSIVSNVPGAKTPYTMLLRGSGIAAPTATTTTATLITNTQARLRGSVKPNHDTAKAFAEYKRTADSVWIRSAELTVAGFAATAVEWDVSGLTPSTAYHYRVGIYNSVNTSAAPVFGATVAFNTTA